MDDHLVSVLEDARDIVIAAGLPEAYQPVAFGRILDLLATESVAPERETGTLLTRTPPQNPPPHDLGPRDTGPENDEAEVIRKIAERLDLPQEVVSEIFFLDGGSLGLSISPGALSTSVRRGARQIAILLAVGRQAAGLDASGWTDSAEIRRICDHYGKFDVGNFGKTLKAMGDVFQIRGRGAARQVRARALAVEQARKLIHSLVGRDES